jgi:SagB-type dehydrogenase family enzyme
MESIGKKFMESTRYGHMPEPPQRLGMKQPPLELPADAAALIPLPAPSGLKLGREPLIDVIERRRSLRAYSGETLTLPELSFLLWCCQGVQQQAEKHTMRTVPSAGARHALETWVLANRVEGLPAGLYRFSALHHALLPADMSEDIAERLTAACLNQGMIRNSAVTVFWAAEVERMAYRYGERGYRYLHLDAGHACQNLCLAAEAVGCGAVPIGAYDDDQLNRALGLDGAERFAIYAAALGKRAE